MGGEAMDICLLKESNKSRFDSYSVRNSESIVSHITFRDCRVHIFSGNLPRNSCILQPKELEMISRYLEVIPVSVREIAETSRKSRTRLLNLVPKLVYNILQLLSHFKLLQVAVIIIIIKRRKFFLQMAYVTQCGFQQGTA